MTIPKPHPSELGSVQRSIRFPKELWERISKLAEGQSTDFTSMSVHLLWHAVAEAERQWTEEPKHKTNGGR